MRIAICDDDKKFNEQICNMIKSYLRQNKISKCEISQYTSGLALLKGFTPDLFDFIFLDVKMPKMNGFDTAKMIREVDLGVDIVFVTHMTDDVQRGYDYNAKGYIYKRVGQEQIYERMDKLIKERLRMTERGFHLVKEKNGGTVLLPLSRILYFESSGHDISAVSESDSHVFIDTLTNLSKELATKGFVRINQSHLVNIDHVFCMIGNQVILKKGKDISIGRSYKKAFVEAYGKRANTKWNL